MARINDVVYRIRRSDRAKAKVVHLDRLAPHQGREVIPEIFPNHGQSQIRQMELINSEDRLPSSYLKQETNRSMDKKSKTFLSSSNWALELPLRVTKRNGRPLTISAEGNIGCGKTTFTK